MMATQKTKFALGLFVTCGVGIAVLAIIWLGMSRYLEKGQYYTTYFNESVQGLSIDSPVKYRGVSIGRVDRIVVAPDANLIQVVLKIESGQTLDHAVVAQLKSVGITGSMFVELDRKRNDEPDKSPTLTFPSEFPIVASKPSNISELWQSINDVTNMIRLLDVEGISERVKWTLDNINQMISDANVREISQKVAITLDQAGYLLDQKRWSTVMISIEESGRMLQDLMEKGNQSLSRLDRSLEYIEGITIEKEQDIKTAIENFKLATENANHLLESGASLVNHTDDSLARIKHEFFEVIRNLGEASENLNRLMAIIADHPSQLMFGEPPVPKNVEQDIHE